MKAYIVANTADAIQFYVAKCFIGLGDIHTLPERGAQDRVLDAVFTTTFYTHTLVAGSDIEFARWVPKRNLVILRADAWAVTAPDANVTLRLSDGVDDYDIVITGTTQSGSNTNQQAYGIDGLHVYVMTNSASTGGLCILTIQYRFA